MEISIQTPKAVKAATSKFNTLTAKGEGKTKEAFKLYCEAAEQVSIVMGWYTHKDTKAAAKEAGAPLPSVKEYLPSVLGKAYSTLRRYVQVAEAIDGGASLDDYLTAEEDERKLSGGDLQVSQLRFLRWVEEGTLEAPAEVEPEEVESDEVESDEVESDGIIRVRAQGCSVDFNPETGEFTANGARAVEVMDTLLAAWAAAQA